MRTVQLWRTNQRWSFVRLPQTLQAMGIAPRHILHVGAHLGQEVHPYRVAGAKRITLVEPTPNSATYLRDTFPDVTVIEAACGTITGPAYLRITGGDGCQNTLRTIIGSGPGVHLPLMEIPITVVTVASIQGDADMLVVDTQGTEVDVLDSADFDPLELVVVETQNSGHPEAASYVSVTDHMASRGWAPVLVWEHEPPDSIYHGYADVFFRRSP